MITSLALARDGDTFALEHLAGLGRWLGEGIASLAAVLDTVMQKPALRPADLRDRLFDEIGPRYADRNGLTLSINASNPDWLIDTLRFERAPEQWRPARSARHGYGSGLRLS